MTCKTIVIAALLLLLVGCFTFDMFVAKRLRVAGYASLTACIVSLLLSSIGD